MSERISKKDVVNMAELVWRRMLATGLVNESDKMVVQQGSPTYGNAWRMFRILEGENGHSEVPGISQGFLAWTAKDAYYLLEARLQMLWCFPEK